MKICIRSQKGRTSSSSSVTICMSPVSFRSFAARRESKVGAYVSGTVKTKSRYMVPAMINVIQYNQRQPRLSAMKPPTRGPMAGPKKGAALKAAMGTPRSSVLHRSARLPPTSVIGAEKAMPSIARHTSRVAGFFATAQGMMKMTAKPRVVT